MQVHAPILLTLGARERQLTEHLLDCAVRHAGLDLVEPMAEVIRALRACDESGACVLEGGHVATLIRCADAACKGRGLDVAEVALSLLNVLRQSPPFLPTPPDEPEAVTPAPLELVDKPRPLQGDELVDAAKLIAEPDVAAGEG